MSTMGLENEPVTRDGESAVSPEEVQRRGSHTVRLGGVLERDPDFYPTQSGGEKAVVRLKVTTPGYTFVRDGQEQTVADKQHFYSATVVGRDAVEAVRGMHAGDTFVGEGAVNTYTAKETGRPAIGVTVFSVSPEMTPDVAREPNVVRIAGEVTESTFKPNRGNPQLDSIDYKVKPFGRDNAEIAVREFGEKARELAESRSVGSRVELDGRLTMSSFEGRNGRVDSYFIATTPREVQALDGAQLVKDRSLERTDSQEPAAERAEDAVVVRNLSGGLVAAVNTALDSCRSVTTDFTEKLHAGVEETAAELGYGGNPAVRGFALAAENEVQTLYGSRDGVTRALERVEAYAKATQELVERAAPGELTAAQRGGIVDSIKDKALELNTPPGKLAGLSDDALLNEYLSSGAAIVDRADLIAQRDAQALEREHGVERASDLEQEAAMEIADEVDLGLA